MWGKREAPEVVMPQLTDHDLFLWHTLRINDALDAGQDVDLPTLPVHFAPMRGDVVWASSPYRRYRWDAPGDGSYYQQGGFFFGTGAVGMAAMAGGILATEIGNSARRRQAQLDTVQRWMETDTGELYLSRYGFYFASQNGLGSWSWEPVTSMELVNFGHVVMTGRSDAGSVRWLLSTFAAELFFTLWARNRHPDHPQFGSRAWLHGDWFARMSQAGYALPPNLSGRWWPAEDHAIKAPATPCDSHAIDATIVDAPVPPRNF